MVTRKRGASASRKRHRHALAIFVVGALAAGGGSGFIQSAQAAEMSAHEKHVHHLKTQASRGKATPAQVAELNKINAAKGVKTGGQRQAAINTAQERIGTPYKYGGTTPKGYDCSGLVMTSVNGATKAKTLPRTADQIYKDKKDVTPTSASKAKAGDLVFYGGKTKSHVAMYLGNGKMLEAPSTGKKVRITKVRSGATYGKVTYPDERK